MSFWKQYFIQLYGFLVKTFLQRWRMPISTVVEILLPCLFTVLLSIAYWRSESTIVPATMYDGGASAVALNMTEFTTYFMCKKAGSTLKVPWYPCAATLNATNSVCLDMIGNGNEICLPTTSYAALSGMLYSMYFGSGPLALNSMDGHLALAAMVTQIARTDNPTYFGRSGRASLSHYGKLLVSSDSDAMAQKFMAFCRSKSGMCAEVLYPTPFASLDAAQDYAATNENTVWGIVDLPSSTLTGTGETEFTISMNFTATANTAKGSTRSLFSRGLTTDGSAGYVLYWTSGFMTLQTFVQEFYMQETLSSNTVVGPAQYDTDAVTGVEGINKYLTPYGSEVIPMPTTAHFDNDFLTKWAYYMPLLAVMAVLYPTSRLVMLIVGEKHNGIREAMLIMGLHPSCLFFGWYASTLVIDIVSSLLAAMFLKVGFFSRVDYGLLVLLYFTFTQQNTALCFLVSSVFKNPRVASWCIAFVLFVCAIPSYSFPVGMTDLQKIFCCLIPCVGYAEVFNMMLDYVSSGWHYGWPEARVGYFDYSMAIGMMWASFGAMMLLGFYFDRVSFGAVGRRAHPLFFLMPLVSLFRKHKAPLVKMSDMGTPLHRGSLVVPETPEASSEPYGESSMTSPLKKSKKDGEDGNRLIEHYNDVVDPLDPSIAAVFHRLRKIYIGGGILGFFYTYFTGLFREGDRVVALDGVTFAMRTGEVSVLLGPNGAGKTTIMGMATGMVSPTNGEVYVRGYDARKHLDACRQNIGYCPQRDIVWSHLTVEEHITFYARMKGSDSIDVRDKVRHVMELVDLTGKRHCKASNLSGGQRRRLCVAIAMVGDSSVLFLDEPTAGMDIKGRKTVYDALNRSRAKRSVLISTHLLDEADRIADRVLIVNNGLLCAEGSTMYLKSQMEVGYVVTCLLEGGLAPSSENRAAGALVDFVRTESYAAQQSREGVERGCVVLGVERRGREVSFRFPMTLLGSAGVGLLTQIQTNSARLHLRNVALNLTTLEDVFFTVTRTRPLMASVAEGELVTGADGSGDSAVATPMATPAEEDLYETNTNAFAVFGRHFRALFMKRCHYAQRDIKLLVYQVLLPVIFLLLSLFMNLVRDPSQPVLRLDMTMYSDYATNPSQVMTAYSDFSGVVMGLARYPKTVTNAFQLSASVPDSAWGSYYLTDFRAIATGQANASYDMSKLLRDEIDTHTSPRYIALAPVGAVYQQGVPKTVPTLMHNSTNNHAAPQALDALYHLARTQLFGTSVPQPTVVNAPMKLGEFEKNMVTINRQVMVGIFIILPFIFIPSNTIGYIVEEKETGARHMQWLSGASVLAYWMSSFVFDMACYIVTQILAFIIFVIFNRTEYVSKDTVGPAIVLFLFFGVTSIPVSYFMSFFFKSSFSAQSTVFCINFTFGFLWVTVESMIAEQALRFAQVVTYILRVFPAVCFGESMYVLSGTEMANMMFPTRVKTSLFALLHINASGSPTGGIGTGLIYMSCVAVGCTIGLIVLEYLRLQRLDALFTRCCTRANEEDAEEHDMLERADPTVLAEEQRVCAEETGPETDRIAVQHLHKQYMGAQHAAVEDITFGVHEGEVMGLLGLNGAGKTTTVSILAGEVVATGGEAFVNHYAVQSIASRSYVGYCPQYDALLCNLSAEEHLWLYGRLRGIREKYIEVEVPVLLRELGLYPFRTQAAGSLSGGNKRRLSLAIALVGHTTSVLLDEPTSGMDAVARAQTCEMVRRLTADKSVVLTTHLLDEVEALADRVAFVVRGNLRCVGTPQELKAAYNKEASYTLNVLFPSTVRLQAEEQELVEKVREYVLQTVAAVDTVSKSKSAITCEVSEVHPCSLLLVVNGDLPAICTVVSQLQSGRAEGIPATTYVSVSQPTLEDILLLQ